MTGPGRLRGGYCEYPGITPPGINPDWWTREQRPSVPAGEPPAAWRQALAQVEPSPVLQQPITPEPVDEAAPEKPEQDGEARFIRRWLALIGRPSRR